VFNRSAEGMITYLLQRVAFRGANLVRRAVSAAAFDEKQGTVIGNKEAAEKSMGGLKRFLSPSP
jgi:hypothetical protein